MKCCVASRCEECGRGAVACARVNEIFSYVPFEIWKNSIAELRIDRNYVIQYCIRKSYSCQ
jgi:hypothetical protein